MSEEPSKEDVHPFQEMCETAAVECFYKDLATLSEVDQETIREVASEVVLEEINDWFAEPKHTRLDRAVIELAKDLRGDAQKPSDNHHPNIHKEE